MAGELIPLGNGSFKMEGDPGEPSTGRPRVSVAVEETLLLKFLAKGRHVLEIGTGLGVSTRALAGVAKTVTTVDVDPWVIDTIWPTLPSNVVGLTPDGLDDQVVPFDMAFIDGDHSPEAVRRDVDLAERLCPGGILVAHDANYGNVQQGLGEGWLVIPTTHGLAIRWAA